MIYFLINIDDYKITEYVPESFIKNNYSIYEYDLIKKILNSFYNIHNFEIKYTENGKPYLDNNLFLSISHDENYLCVCISKEEVGIDIQFKKEFNNNINSILNVDKKLDNNDVTNIFSKKEAIIKLEGKRLKDINNINIDDYHIKSIEYNDFLLNIATFR